MFYNCPYFILLFDSEFNQKLYVFLLYNCVLLNPGILPHEWPKGVSDHNTLTLLVLALHTVRMREVRAWFCENC